MEMKMTMLEAWWICDFCDYGEDEDWFMVEGFDLKFDYGVGWKMKIGEMRFCGFCKIVIMEAWGRRWIMVKVMENDGEFMLNWMEF